MEKQTKPSDFTSYPWSSVLGKSENEVVALNIMKVLTRTGNEWRLLTWNEYQTERKKDGNFSSSEKLYFDQVMPYCKSPEKAISFSPHWNVPITMEKQTEKITWKELKDFVNSIPEELLSKKASLLLEDETYARQLDEPFFIREDIYANKEDGDDCGTLEELKEVHEDDDFDLEDYILVTRKGTPFLYIS